MPMSKSLTVRCTRKELRGDAKNFIAMMDRHPSVLRYVKHWQNIRKGMTITKSRAAYGQPFYEICVSFVVDNRAFGYHFDFGTQKLMGVVTVDLPSEKKSEAPKPLEKPKMSEPGDRATIIDFPGGPVTYDVPVGKVPCRFSIGDTVARRIAGGIEEVVERIKWVSEVWHSLEPHWRLETDVSGGPQVGYRKLAGIQKKKQQSRRCMASCGHMVTFFYVPPRRPVCPDYCDACRC